MCGELPVCRRCCFCLPLRYGLITWGYFKLILLAFFITGTCNLMYCTLLHKRFFGNENKPTLFDFDIAIISIVLILLITDFVLTTVFIVGGHRKNLKLLRVFYFYSIALCVIAILLLAVVFSFCLKWWVSLQMSTRSWMMNILGFSIYLVYIGIQTYFLLLVRSEIIKLRNNCEFRFVNNAMEAESTMRTDGEVVDGVKDTEII